MTNTKITFDFQSTLKEDIARIPEKDRTNLTNNIEHFIYLENIKNKFKEYQSSIQFQQKQENLLNTFSKFRKKLCLNLNCIFYPIISPICTDCLLHAHSIAYKVIDNNHFYYSSKTRQVYISKKDLKDLKKLFVIQVTQNYSPNNDKDTNFIQDNTSTLKPQKITEDELSIFVRIHREFSKNSGIQKYTSSNICHPPSYQIIASQLAKTFFNLFKATNIITQTNSWDEQIQKGFSEFSCFVLQNFYLSTDILLQRQATFGYTLKACNSQIPYVLQHSLKPFSKLIRTLYAISGGNILTIKQLAVMLAKIFIGRKYLKELDSDNKLAHFTIIISDNPKYIRDFLMDILAYDLSPKNLDYSDPRMRNVSYRHKPNKLLYLATEHTSAYLCNKENISNLIKEKLLGNIVNIDTKNASIESGTFSKLLKSIAISCPDDKIFNNKLTYRSNAHYINICHTINELDVKGTGGLFYDTIICSGKVHNACYEPLDAYELFFLVSGFLNYGISLLGYDFTIEDAIYTKHSVPNQTETIRNFITEFYDDTFDLKKANHSQKADSNDFADIDNDIYPTYKKWFNLLYKNATACTADFLKSKLKDIYIERKVAKNLTCLSKVERQAELTHRYFKNNKTDHRGISGLKLNKLTLQIFLNNCQQMLCEETTTKNTFANYLQQEIFDKYSPYND